MASKGNLKERKKVNALCRLNRALQGKARFPNTKRVRQDVKRLGLEIDHSGRMLVDWHQCNPQPVIKSIGLPEDNDVMCSVEGCTQLAVGDGLCIDHQI